VRGKTLAKARRLLELHHCALGKVRRLYSTSVRPGLVSGQQPAAGARRAKGARVNLTVSRGLRPRR
jgi:beta-lactam-binding protein with PASTA domain